MQEGQHVGALTIADFNRTYGVKKSFTYSEIRAGRLIAHKARSKTLIFKDDAARWAKALPAIKPRVGA